MDQNTHFKRLQKMKIYSTTYFQKCLKKISAKQV